MQKIRRYARAVLGTLPLVLLAVRSSGAQAQSNYPDKPIRVVVPYNAGGYDCWAIPKFRIRVA